MVLAVTCLRRYWVIRWRNRHRRLIAKGTRCDGHDLIFFRGVLTTLLPNLWSEIAGWGLLASVFALLMLQVAAFFECFDATTNGVVVGRCLVSCRRWWISIDDYDFRLLPCAWLMFVLFFLPMGLRFPVLLQLILAFLERSLLLFGFARFLCSSYRPISSNLKF